MTSQSWFSPQAGHFDLEASKTAQHKFQQDKLVYHNSLDRKFGSSILCLHHMKLINFSYFCGGMFETSWITLYYNKVRKLQWFFISNNQFTYQPRLGNLLFVWLLFRS